MLIDSRARGKLLAGGGTTDHGTLEQLVFGSRLVFNQVWEDPEVDRQALAVTQNDTVLAIASAGDNALNLALAGAQKVYAIDLNPAQISLLNLKIAAAQHLAYADFYHLFSLAPAPRAEAMYAHSLRAQLDAGTRQYWDAHLAVLRRGLYRAGSFGGALWLLRNYLRVVCGPRTLEQFFECESIAEQAEFYRQRIHARWWNPVARAFAAQWAVLLLFGAHPQQARRVRTQPFADQLAANIARALTTLPARDNFFWQQVFLGRYLAAPPYMRAENFGRLKQAASRVETHIGRVENLMRGLPGASISRFSLLDAVDWLSAEQTVEWWSLIRRCATPDARVLFRSIDPMYRLPQSILADWQDASEPQWTGCERTGIYAGVHLYVRRQN